VLLTGDINDDVVRQLFSTFDTDNSGAIDKEEMKGLLLGISLSTNDSSNVQDIVQYHTKTFDVDIMLIACADDRRHQR